MFYSICILFIVIFFYPSFFNTQLMSNNMKDKTTKLVCTHSFSSSYVLHSGIIQFTTVTVCVSFVLHLCS